MSSKGGHILSDRRLKKNITDYIGNATDLIDNIHIVEYEWKNEEEVKQDLIKNKTQNKKLLKTSRNTSAGKKVGVIAQDMREKIPSCVWGDESEIYGVDWLSVMPYIVKSIQERKISDTNPHTHFKMNDIDHKFIKNAGNKSHQEIDDEMDRMNNEITKMPHEMNKMMTEYRENINLLLGNNIKQTDKILEDFSNNKKQMNEQFTTIELKLSENKKLTEDMLEKVKLNSVDDKKQMDEQFKMIELKLSENKKSTEEMLEKIKLNSVDDKKQINEQFTTIELKLSENKKLTEEMLEKIKLNSVDDKKQMDEQFKMIELKLSENKKQTEDISDNFSDSKKFIDEQFSMIKSEFSDNKKKTDEQSEKILKNIAEVKENINDIDTVLTKQSTDNAKELGDITNELVSIANDLSSVREKQNEYDNISTKQEEIISKLSDTNEKQNTELSILKEHAKGVNNGLEGLTNDINEIKKDLLDKSDISEQLKKNISDISRESLGLGNIYNEEKVLKIQPNEGNIELGNEECNVILRGDISLKDIDMNVSTSGGPPLQIDLQTHKIFYSGISDERLKKNIYDYVEDATYYLNKIKICSFEYKTQPEVINGMRRLGISDNANKSLINEANKLPGSIGRPTVGGIAQEIKKVFPGCVSGSDDTVYSINWSYMIPYMIKSIQDIDTRIKDISERLGNVEKLVIPQP